MRGRRFEVEYWGFFNAKVFVLFWFVEGRSNYELRVMNCLNWWRGVYLMAPLFMWL